MDLCERTCGACGGTAFAPAIRLRELMNGPSESFDYVRCLDCGCLQIVAIPDDMAKFYGDAYYSFASQWQSRREWLRDWLTLHGPAWLLGRFAWYRRGLWRCMDGVARSARIIDVGCGFGHFAGRLRDFGFRNVYGIDAFIEGDSVLPNGVRIERKAIGDVAGPYDVVMMHHSLEHMPDQLATLKIARTIMADGGQLIIRIPVIDSWAAEHFGPDWAHLDPPRHFFLHTRRSIARLLERANLELEGIVDDWYEFGVRGSLKVRMGHRSIAPCQLPETELAEAMASQRQAFATGRSDSITVFARSRAANSAPLAACASSH